MPLKLVPPRKGKSPNWSMRGTHLRVYVDRSCGTDRQAIARRILRDLESRIERGEYPEKPVAPTGPTFLSAAIAYMRAGGEREPMARLIAHFGETPIAEIDQQVLDAAAIALHPDAKPATRNRKVYTPVSAVLHHAGLPVVFRRPAKSKGEQRTDFMTPADATAVIAAAEAQDAEFGLMLRFLLYTGVRIGEALALRWEDTQIEEAYALVRTSKNGDPRPLRLRPDLRDALIAHRDNRDFGKVFRFRMGGGFKERLVKAKLTACGVPIPARRRHQPKEERRIPPHRLHWVTFHTFRHTWATWMRRYGGLDEIGLIATGNWRDPRSARRYAHAVPRDEWAQVDALPDINTGGADVDKIKTGT